MGSKKPLKAIPRPKVRFEICNFTGKLYWYLILPIFFC
jgi:hypothetical protein